MAADKPDTGPAHANGARLARLALLARVMGALSLLLLGAAVWLITDRSAVREIQQDAGPIPFFVALAVLPAIGFPTTPFFVLAGGLFGIWTGMTGSALAIAANLVLCHWISKSGLRPVIERLLAGTRYRVPDLSTKPGGGLRFTVLLRFAPGIPTFIKNYLLGVSGVPFRTYFFVSFAFTYAYAATFIIMGESIFDRDFGTVGIVAGVLFLGAMIVVWRRGVRQRANAPVVPDGAPPGS
jgi:uncharacterized membrane protein YdjX (TVP38/TMEM64 family)